ncbi:MAG: DUF5658 family protein [Pseudomonadota bacterium]
MIASLIVVALLVAFVLLQVADIITTMMVLRRPDGYERNPIVRWAMRAAGSSLRGLLLTKLIAVPLLIWGMLSIAPGAGVIAALVAIDAAYLIVVLNNAREARR